MKIQDVIKRVRNAAGDLDVFQFTDETVIDWINDGIRECAINNNLLQKTASSDTVVGQSEYMLPADILKLHSILIDGSKMKIMTLQEWEELNAGDLITNQDNTSGQPFQCYIWAGRLNVWPTPDRVQKLKVNYTYDAAQLTDSDGDKSQEIPLPVGYHSRIFAYCMAQAALQDDDLNKYQLFLNEFNTGVANLKDQHNTEEDLYPFISVSSRDMGGFEFGEYQW